MLVISFFLSTAGLSAPQTTELREGSAEEFSMEIYSDILYPCQPSQPVDASS